MKINTVTIDGIVYTLTDGTLTPQVIVPPVTPPPEPPSDYGRLLFNDDFTTLTSLSGMNTTQITSGGKVSLVQGHYLECYAPSGGVKAETGHDWPVEEGIKAGQMWTFTESFLVLAGGPSELFLMDVESDAAASEAGPRLRRKNGGWGIEQDKFGGANIQPTSPPVPTFVNGVRYDILWQSMFHQSAGWHKLTVNGAKVFDTDVDGKRGKTGPVENLNRFRGGISINSSNAPATVRVFNWAGWVK